MRPVFGLVIADDETGFGGNVRNAVRCGVPISIHPRDWELHAAARRT